MISAFPNEFSPDHVISSITSAANSLLANPSSPQQVIPTSQKLEAIWKIVRLMETYPFPACVQVGLENLAMANERSPKLLQYQIYKAFKHIKQQRVISKSVSSTGITLNGAQVGFSASKVLRWINKVILDSNDDVARAVALKIVECLVDIGSDSIEIQQAIRRRLIESTSPIEISAAIDTTDIFLAQSEAFATNVIDDLATMIQDPKRPADVKERIIYLLRHMHYNIQLATRARKICTGLLERDIPLGQEVFPAIILKTLTLLTKNAVFEMSNMVHLLFNYLTQTLNPTMRCGALRDLDLLLRTEGTQIHDYFSEERVKIILQQLEEPSPLFITQSLSILRSLLCSNAPKIKTYLLIKILELKSFDSLVLHKNHSIGTAMLSLVCDLATEGKHTGDPEVMQNLFDLVIGVLRRFMPDEKTKLEKLSDARAERLKSVCKALLRMSSLISDENYRRLVSIEMKYLSRSEGAVACIMSRMIFLQTLNHSSQKSLFVDYIPSLIELLGSEAFATNNAAFLNVFKTVILVAEYRPQLMSSILESTDPWCTYNIVKSTVLFCNDRSWLNEDLQRRLNGICDIVEKEQNYYWLTHLSHLIASQRFMHSLFDGTESNGATQSTCIQHAIEYLNLGITCLNASRPTDHASAGAASTSSSVALFQIMFLNIRIDYLSTVKNILTALNVGRSNPFWLLERGWRVLKTSVKSIHKSGANYRFLACSFLDIPDGSLCLLELLAFSCEVLAYAIGSIVNQIPLSFNPVLVSPNLFSVLNFLSLSTDVQDRRLYQHIVRNHSAVGYKYQHIVTSCVDILKRVESISNFFVVPDSKIGAKDGDIAHRVINDIDEVVLKLMKIPFNLPDYYFQHAPKKVFQVTTMPTSTPTNPIKLPPFQDLNLKLDCIISQSLSSGSSSHPSSSTSSSQNNLNKDFVKRRNERIRKWDKLEAAVFVGTKNFERVCNKDAEKYKDLATEVFDLKKTDLKVVGRSDRSGDKSISSILTPPTIYSTSVATSAASVSQTITVPFSRLSLDSKLASKLTGGSKQTSRNKRFVNILLRLQDVHGKWWYPMHDGVVSLAVEVM